MMLNYRAVLVSDANAALGNEAAPAGLLHHADSAATAEYNEAPRRNQWGR
jgi:hypothetical protein